MSVLSPYAYSNESLDFIEQLALSFNSSEPLTLTFEFGKPEALLPKLDPKLLVDWDGPCDPEDPKTWSLSSKIFHSAIPAVYGFVVTFGTSVYAAGIFQISAQLDISREIAILGISLYSFGLALGPIIAAPISETYGRKPVYLITLPIFFLYTLGAGLSQNAASLLICRLFAGAFGAPPLAVGAGTVADVWEMDRGGGLAAVLVTQTVFFGPSIGPLVGGFVMQARNDWRQLMWVTLALSSLLFPALFFMKETSKKQILKQRAKKYGLIGPPKLPLTQSLKVLIMMTLFRPVHMLFTEPIVASMTLYNAFVFGVLFAFFDSYPYVFQTVYGFTGAQVGLAFMGFLLGTVLAVVTFIIVDRTLYEKAKRKAAGRTPAPEERLYTSMLGSFGIPISLFWFAWTARPDIHWIIPALAGVPFGWGIVALFLGAMAYLIDTYHAYYGASAIAANSLLRYLVGGCFPLFTIQMYEMLGIAWATSLLGFIGVAMLPIPWVLYRWGPYLRSKSAFKPDQF